MSPMRDERTTSKDRATQLLICESLSFATDFATKQCKSQKNDFTTDLRKKGKNTRLPCGQISPHDRCFSTGITLGTTFAHSKD